ncbi:hypothetical protein [Streptomyces sp. NPDC050704]|uniref:hypothetical protein n=1 Tax=Streptomyces sp. NPDC050704 TaxID=3157219 RepID=UPI00343319C6
MNQQISVEDAFPTFQKRCAELFEENLLLRAQVDVLQRQLDAASPAPVVGPDLAEQHPRPDDERG